MALNVKFEDAGSIIDDAYGVVFLCTEKYIMIDCPDMSPSSDGFIYRKQLCEKIDSLLKSFKLDYTVGITRGGIHIYDDMGQFLIDSKDGNGFALIQL